MLMFAGEPLQVVTRRYLLRRETRNLIEIWRQRPYRGEWLWWQTIRIIGFGDER